MCHPACPGRCFFPFNWRYCFGDAANGECRADVDGSPITPPSTGNVFGGPSFLDQIDYDPRNDLPRDVVGGDVVRSMPPQCNADAYDNAGEWAQYGGKTYNNNFNDNWFDQANAITAPDPFVAVPLDRAPQPMDTILTAIVPGTTPPPFVPVPHNETITNTTATATPVRTEASEWWKLWLLIGALLLLLTVLLLAMFCGPKERIRTPIKRVEEEIPILVQEQVVVE